MVNLNDEKYNTKKLITKKSILNDISDIDIYRYYLNSDLTFGLIKSPLREEDNASFGFFQRDNEIFFKDFVLGGGDCIKFVKLLFGLNYNEALSKIAIDFGLSNKYILASSLDL